MNLKWYCLADVDMLMNLGNKVVTKRGQYSHVDNGGDVLAVVHADTVARGKPKFSYTLTGAKSIALDDRLGVYMAFEMLPKLGVVVDVLITDNEEIMRSTGAMFVGKEYNWLMGLDRNGTDVVMYQYHSRERETMLRGEGWKVSHGSYSDICDMEGLGVVGFNFGIGYRDAHTEGCHCRRGTIKKQAKRIAEFWRKHHETKFVFEHEDSQEWSEWQYLSDEPGFEGTEGVACPGCGLTHNAMDLVWVADNYYCFDCVWGLDDYPCPGDCSDCEEAGCLRFVP